MATRSNRRETLAYERRLRDLDILYATAQATIAARVEAAIRGGDFQTSARMRLQLAAVVAVLDQLGAEVTPLARQIVADAYQDGADRALAQIRRLSIRAPEIPGAFAGVQFEAVQQLQASLLDRLDATRQTIGRQVEDVYARETRRAALRAVLGANGSPRTAALDLQQRLLRDRTVQELVRDGGTGFIDRAGKRWRLDTYAEMAIRTQTREAVVQGGMARMVSHGIELARVSFTAGSCDRCRPWEGRLIALDGATSEFGGEPVFDSSNAPPYHPNCTHSLSPVATRIEDLKREMEAV
jgi:hypothetical protein